MSFDLLGGTNRPGGYIRQLNDTIGRTALFTYGWPKWRRGVWYSRGLADKGATRCSLRSERPSFTPTTAQRRSSRKKRKLGGEEKLFFARSTRAT